MKFIKYILCFHLILFGASYTTWVPETPNKNNLLIEFSNKIKRATGLVVSTYGYNTYLPRDYKIINGMASFSLDYNLVKTRQSVVSLKEARNLLISVTESLLKKINSDPEMKKRLDVYPCTNDLIRICIYIQDENHIDLGQGISTVFFSRGKIKYEYYQIHEYRNSYPAIGKHFTVHEESYVEALDIVKKQGALMDLAS
jgi:hypothetical protein